MIRSVARALMRLAVASLGPEQTIWARAMVAEYGVALADGHGLGFAAGCLRAAVMESLRSSLGRAKMASLLVAIGLLVPGAGYQLLCVIGYPFLPLGTSSLFSALSPGSAQDIYFGDAFRGAAPALIALRLLLVVGHFRLAWALLDRDWTKVIQAGALVAAAATTLMSFTAILLLHDPALPQQAILLAIELSALTWLWRWFDAVERLSQIRREHPSRA